MYHIDNDVAEEASKDDKHPSELQRHSFKIYCNRLDNNGTLDEFRDIITQEVL
jgi:translation initiation factor 2 beta subunit (eIF-2beta)/eIF-5